MTILNEPPAPLPAPPAGPTMPREPLPQGSAALLAICFGLPVLFLMGAGVFVWGATSILLVFVLVTRGQILIPRGTVPLLLFIAWVALSVLSVSELPTLFLFAFRFLALASIPAFYLWLVNTPTSVLPSSRVVSWLSALFLTLIGFGYLAMLFPNVDVSSPLQALLPASFVANDYLYDVTRIRFAESQDFLGFSFDRPAAPLTYANTWGSAVGILAPFFAQHWVMTKNAARRRRGFVLAAIAFVPVVTSLNRGLWLVLVVAMLYAAFIETRRGQPRFLVAIVAALVLSVGVVAVSPLGDLVQSRLDSTADSNADRTSAYEEAFEGAMESPLLGHGQPTSVDDGLPIGTHGLIWYTMYSHGFPALLFFGWWLVSIGARSRGARTSIGVWAHIAIVVFLMEFFFYGLLPHAGLVGIAAGISVRERVAARDAGTTSPASVWS